MTREGNPIHACSSRRRPVAAAIDILVNNAGINIRKPVRVAFEEWQQVRRDQSRQRIPRAAARRIRI